MHRTCLILIICACSSKRAHEPPQTGSAVAAAPIADAAPTIDAAVAPDPHVRVAVFKDGGGYMYLDATGKQAFDGVFESEARFHGGRACVVVDKNERLIDEHGKVIAKRPGFWCGGLDFTDGFVMLEDKILDPDAKPVATIRFNGKTPDEVQQFSDGLAAVRFGSKWGFVDHTGKLVIEPSFGPDAIWKPGPDDAIDPGGNPIPPSDYYDYVGEFHEGLAPARKADLWGYIDRTGAFAIAPRFAELPFHPQFHEGLAKFYDGKKVGFMDKTGKPAIAASYDDATVFSEGVACVHADRWKYVDRTGKTVFELDPAMTYGDSFSDGLAMIRKGELGKTGTTFCFVDHRGMVAIPCTLSRGGMFEHGVAYVDGSMLSPDFWIGRVDSPDRVLLPRDQIALRNGMTTTRDPAVVDLNSVATTLTREAILRWIKDASSSLTRPLVDDAGLPIPASTLSEIQTNIGIDAIPATTPTRYAMAVRRAPLRTYPTALHAYASKDSTDFDTFVAGTLFPGDPVVLVHASVDGKWSLIVSYQGPAWVATSDVAEGTAQAVFDYGRKSPFRVVTADETHTVFTPEAPDVSQLQLDMGARLPLVNAPADKVVNGQGPFESWAIELPVRGDDGALRFEPALVQKTRDTSPDYLPLTRANLIRQAFKFLGERYGWGHAYNARDCSGFTSDVYRSMGLLLPPNAGAQGNSPAFPHRLFTAADSHAARMQAIMDADVGDLIVVPGHVQMILGKVNGEPYVIQDVPFVIYRDDKGAVHWTKVNEVSVTPLFPLLADGHQSYVDLMTSLVHVTGAG